MRNLFSLIFFSSFFSFLGQETGDSILFTTNNGKNYRGILEKKDQDGYFFKTSNNRIIYLSNSEIKEFQKIKKEILKDNPSIKVNPEIATKENNANKIVTEDFNNSAKTEYSLKQISVLIGLEDVTIVLNDGRNFKGKIQRIEYPNGIEQVSSKMIWFESDDKNYKFKEHEISKVFKDVAVINPKKKIIEKGAYLNEGYSESNEDNAKPVSLIIHGWSGFGNSGGSGNLLLGSLAELKINNIKINGEDIAIGLGIDYSYIERATRRYWYSSHEWQRIHFRVNTYGLAKNENIYFGIGIGIGKSKYDWNDFSLRVCLGGKYNISENFGLMGEVGIGAAFLRGGLFIKI